LCKTATYQQGGSFQMCETFWTLSFWSTFQPKPSAWFTKESDFHQKPASKLASLDVAIYPGQAPRPLPSARPRCSPTATGATCESAAVPSCGARRRRHRLNHRSWMRTCCAYARIDTPEACQAPTIASFSAGQRAHSLGRFSDSENSLRYLQLGSIHHIAISQQGVR
jgi:hypothetical protein